jgi:hypothetical protein
MSDLFIVSYNWNVTVMISTTTQPKSSSCSERQHNQDQESKTITNNSDKIITKRNKTSKQHIIRRAGTSLRQHTNNSILATAHCSRTVGIIQDPRPRRKNKIDEEGPWMVREHKMMLCFDIVLINHRKTKYVLHVCRKHYLLGANCC